MNCQGTTAKGEPCESPMADDSGYCPTHRIRSMGGKATAAKYASKGYAEGEVPRITTLDEAKSALADIHISVLTRRITDREANAGTKTIAEWIKGDTASITKNLVNELTAELQDKTKEIDALRKQLAKPMRVAS
jgi:hypothetical protein